MERLNKIKDKVRSILESNSSTRDSDKYLMLHYLRKHNKVAINMTSSEFRLLKDVFMSMPSFESITRARRKAQEENPHLKGDVVYQRALEEREYRLWAKQ